MQKKEICSILKKFIKGFPEEFCEEDAYISFINFLPKTFYTSWDLGATKCVLLNNKWNYVIKIPFTGEFNLNKWEDQDGTSHYEENYEEFCNANELPLLSSETSCWDYCEAESLIYNQAKENGLEDFFAKTEFIGNLYGHPIYIQEKVTVFNYIEASSRYKNIDKNKVREELNCFFINSFWLIDALQYYGYEKTNKFISFLNKNSLDKDLHVNNIGYIGARPVLLDYVGWRS